MTFIYFSPNMERRTDKNLIDTVAHEVAHVVLGHPGMVIGASNYECEKAADGLTVSWGFQASYTKKKLEEMKRREQEIKDWNKRDEKKD